MNKLLASSIVIAAGLGSAQLALTSPASAADTTVTMQVLAGSLSISAPASSDLGSTNGGGGTVSGQLGAISVTDARASLAASWDATVQSTGFTTGGGTPAETIPASSVSYWSGQMNSTTGVGVFTPGQPTAGQAVAINTGKTAVNLSSGIGSNSASWNPTVVIDVPNAAVAGTYTGTVTHSVL